MDRDPLQRLGASARDAEIIKEHPFFDGLNNTVNEAPISKRTLTANK